MRLAQPPGVRSTRRGDGSHGLGGKWQQGHRRHGGSVVHTDFDELFQCLAPSDAALLKQEMRHKLKDAEAGSLIYSDDARDGDVCVMECAKMILELRFDDYGHYDAVDECYKTRKIRLYFSEPAMVEGVLVMLALRSKMPGPLGLEEQNHHAKEAEKFAYEHGDYEKIA